MTATQTFLQTPDFKDAEKLSASFQQTNEIQTEFKSFPVPNEKCFYGLAGDFVRLIEPHTEADKMSLLSQFLVYAGNIIGRSAYYQIEGDRHYTNINCLIVGDTARGRKGTSFGRVKQIFRGIDEGHETDCLTSGLASGEGLLWQIRDAVFAEKEMGKSKKIETVCTDRGVSDKRLLIVEGEFAQVLKKQKIESSSLSTTIRNLWDTGTTKSLTKNSAIRTTDAHVSIIGHITATELETTLTDVDSANGYANRFLFFLVRQSKFLPFGSDIPKQECELLKEKIENFISFSRNIDRINFSIEASKLWGSIYEHLETSRYGFLARITQRASPYVIRLSMIYALLDQSRLIEKHHLEAALAAWNYSENSARFIFGEKLDNPTAQRILDLMRESTSGISRTDIRDLFQNHKSKKEIDTALQYLKENRLAEVKKEKTGGKPKELWIICDKSYKSYESDGKDTTLVAFVADKARINGNGISGAILCPDCKTETEFIPSENIYFCGMCGFTQSK